ncbi:tetracycline resistance (probable transport) [Fusarium albosuccineum]|uniref:Tetracycline resistance (Probable transport) n=1 Tax=Fusarium albosuccineum TaxID=1237068 RepID=A0A8H4PD97_9HYPO|nr:tetracycline resistance (probable transport) [Fusarium albosuccineum]
MAAIPRRSPSPGSRLSQDASETAPLLVGGQLAPDADTEASTLIGTASPTTRAGSVSGSTPEYGTAGSSGDGTGANGDGKPSKPLPKLQIFLLCYARMTEPIAFFCIFPFIAQMVQRNGHLPDTDVGFYSGLIESLFSATQMVVLIGWGRLADRIGRKPILVITLIGTAIAPALFGMARTIWQMILFRCLAGIFSGSSLVIRTMISEHSTPETQARAFSWFAFAGNLGIFIGPILGGALADPAHQYPGAFKHLEFFREYPYALPGFVTGAISATSALTSALFLKETLKKQGRDEISHQDITSRPPLSTWELLKAPSVAIVLWVYGHAMFLAFAFTAILPVVLFTPIHLGGVGFDSFKISMYMAVQGASQALWLLLAFPALQHRFGTRGVMKLCGYAYPFFFVGYILLNTLLRADTHTTDVLFWIFGALVAVVGPGVSMAFTGVQLALNDVAPDSHVLGTLNALALTFSSAIRAIVPGAATAIFAVGVRGQIFWGHLAWVILIPLAMAFTVACQYLPEGHRPAKDSDENDENEP